MKYLGALAAVLSSAALASAQLEAKDYDYKAPNTDWPELCRIGPDQSPVKIVQVVDPAMDSKLSVKFGLYPNSTEYEISNTGVTLEVERISEQQPTLTIVDDEGTEKIFTLTHYHPHTLSEHYIGEMQYGAEFHAVHTRKYMDGETEKTEIAVVGILLQADDTETAKDFAPLTVLLDNPPEVLSSKFVQDPALDWRVMVEAMGEDKELVQYMGSLTTPPCTTGVIWNVFTTPLKVKTAQIDALRAQLKVPQLLDATQTNDNSRPLPADAAIAKGPTTKAPYTISESSAATTSATVALLAGALMSFFM